MLLACLRTLFDLSFWRQPMVIPTGISQHAPSENPAPVAEALFASLLIANPFTDPQTP